MTQDGHAKVTIAITDDDYQPLREGTRVMIKQASLSGIANRYVDLQLGPADGEEIDDGGVIGADQTATAVELDQIFNLFDERTRTGLQDFFKGSADDAARARQGAPPRRPLPEPRAQHGRAAVPGAHARRGAARALPRGLRHARERARRPAPRTSPASSGT